MKDNRNNYDDLESILKEFSGGRDDNPKKPEISSEVTPSRGPSIPERPDFVPDNSADPSPEKTPEQVKRAEALKTAPAPQNAPPASVAKQNMDNVPQRVSPSPAAKPNARAAASAPGFYEGYEDTLNPGIYVPVKRIEAVTLDTDGNPVAPVSGYGDRSDSRAASSSGGECVSEYEEYDEVHGGEYDSPNLFPGDLEEEEYEEQFAILERRKKRLRLIIPLVIVCLVLSAAAYFTFYYANKIAASREIFPNVYIDGIEVSGMTETEARSFLKECNWEKTVSGELEIRLPLDIKGHVEYVTSGIRLSAEDAVELAVKYGRDDNKLKQLKNYVNAMILPTDVIEREIVIDTEYVEKQIDEAIAEFDKYVSENAEIYDIENAEYKILKGANEIKIDREALIQKVYDALKTEEESVVYRVPDDVQLTAPDFKQELKAKKADPSDAYYDKASDKIVEEIVGSEFDPDQALTLWKAAGPLDVVDIPLSTTPAKTTAEELNKILFKDTLGEYQTYYTGSTDNRISNIHLAVQQINNMVLMPGETFSYNDILGPRTKDKGYLEAAAYDNDEIIQSLGGGICQVSSTICCAVRLARLEYTRTCHQYKVAYLDYGLDATVDYAGKVDFTFTNNKEYPIRIVIELNDNDLLLYVKIIGTDTDHYKTEFKNTFVANLKHADGFPEDTDHSEAYNNTTVGYIYDAYVEVYDEDGNFVEEIYNAQSDRCWYYFHKEDRSYPEYEQPSDDSGTSDEPTDFFDPSVG